MTLDQAIDSKLISKIVVSTDSDQVIKICKKKKYLKKINVPFKRPKNISLSNSPISKAIIHTLNYYKKLKEEFDYIILLEPTSPIRFKNDIDNSIKKFLRKKNFFDGMVSIGEIKTSPFLFKYEYKNKIKNLFNLKNKNLNRQNLKDLFSFWSYIFVKINTYLKKKLSIIKERCFIKLK